MNLLNANNMTEAKPMEYTIPGRVRSLHFHSSPGLNLEDYLIYIQ